MLNASQLAERKEELLRHPSLINARATALQLIIDRYKCDPRAAHFRLDELQSKNVLTTLFKEVLPWHYRRALNSRSKHDLSTQFIRLLEFPVNEDWMMEIIDEGEDPKDFSIPIYPMNPGIWNGDYEFEDMHLVYQMAILVYRPNKGYHVQGQDPQHSWHHLATKYKLSPDLQPTENISMPALFKLFSKQPSPLRHLPLTINMIDYNTGTIFFDFDYDMGEPDIPWSKDSIQWLRTQYKIATKLEHKIGLLGKWLLAKPKERITEVCRLYHTLEKDPHGNS